MIALRVGELTANAADCTAVSTSSSAGLSQPEQRLGEQRRAWPPRSASDEPSSSLRRSTASATAPPHSPKTTSGTSAATPSRPTQNDEPA